MPVNMDPSKKRRRSQPQAAASSEQTPAGDSPAASTPAAFGEETEADREKALADAESKNLWDATEVIDMDKV
jgi:hypothetical protein